MQYPHDPAHLMTKIAGAPYHQFYEHRDWKQALQAIPEDVRDWYQVRLGQALTGHMTPDDLLIVAQGGGGNGKSTINIGTAKAAGSYYLLASDRILLANPDHHPTELMDLMGVRYAVAEETPEARRLAVARLKKTIGTPEISGRKVHKDDVTFSCTHSFFLSTNYRPMVEETDNGTWRRLALLKFPYTYRKTQAECLGPDDILGDPNLRARCTNDRDVHTAALAWMVAGAVKWYENDRVMPDIPERIAADTLEWRKESDQVLSFMDEYLVWDPDRCIATMDLLDEVNAWLKARGHHTWSDKTLAARFGDHDEVIQHHVTARRVRRSEAVSRPAETTDFFDPNPYHFASPRPERKQLPERFRAWQGVRFRTWADDQAETKSTLTRHPTTGSVKC
jgi:putative DNA primase/helicase